MSTIELLMTIVAAGMVVYGFSVAWFRPDIVRYWVEEGRMFHGKPSAWEYTVGLWMVRFIMTLMLLALLYLAGLFLVGWIRSLAA